MKPRVLIVTPKFPYPAIGACEIDRTAGIEYFLEHGWEVHVVSKIYHESYRREAERIGEEKGFGLTLLPYTFLQKRSLAKKLKDLLYRITHPWFLNGAAYEYANKETKAAVDCITKSFQPQLVWVDYTYLWPLYGIFKRQGIPIITRSTNFEATHAVEESGGSFMSYAVYPFKWISEVFTARKSNYIFAITPKEAERYKRLTQVPVAILPLRGLPKILKQQTRVQARRPLEVGFAGSTYNVAHNRAALRFLLERVAPLAERTFPGEFRFHIFGSKIPAEFDSFFNASTVKHGYLETSVFNDWQRNLDIVVAPSLAGAGMQQKIFDPLTRGIPTIASPRGLAGYPFSHDVELYTATNARDFVVHLGKLRDFATRERLSQAVRQKAEKLFSAQALDAAMKQSLETVSIQTVTQ